MTEIMISIKPEWCEKILALQKRWEIRKTMPTSRAIPCQCYIYQTGGGGVIGEFTCDSIEEIRPGNITNESLKDSFLTVSEAESYAAGNTLYRWRISSLVIYHEPRPVSLYGLDRPPQSWCYVRGDHHEES
jgi:predicted transcriptional regulator